MAPLSGKRPAAAGAAIGAVLLAVLTGCGSGSSRAHAAVPERPCPATVLEALSKIVARVYHEGVLSERTVVAQRAIATSPALRAAVEHGDAGAARAAALALVASGRMTNLRVVAHGRVLADVGGEALAPLGGTITDASGHQIGTYLTSVWSDEGFIAESRGLTQSTIVVRSGRHDVGGSHGLPGIGLPPEGMFTHAGVRYHFAAFPALAYPAGHVRVYVVRPDTASTPLCGATSEQTTTSTLSRIARLIYDGEAGRRTLPQVRRVQRDGPLLEAVARRDPVAARLAIDRLLSEHIVRLRVFAGSSLLDDVGGPYVLAPVRAPLRLHGRTIGSFVLSIQDDEGYLRLTHRLAGLSVLMYMGNQLVKNSLGPQPGDVPASGRYEHDGTTYQVYTLHAGAFPTGPLTVRVLIPIPYG